MEESVKNYKGLLFYFKDSTLKYDTNSALRVSNISAAKGIQAEFFSEHIFYNSELITESKLIRTLTGPFLLLNQPNFNIIHLHLEESQYPIVVWRYIFLNEENVYLTFTKGSPKKALVLYGFN